MSLWEKLKRNQEQIGALLTPAERLFAYSWLSLTMVLPFAGAILIGAGGGTRRIGIGLLVAGLVFVAVPISPILRARIRRREQENAERTDGRSRR
jgi:hypothetical protein